MWINKSHTLTNYKRNNKFIQIDKKKKKILPKTDEKSVIASNKKNFTIDIPCPILFYLIWRLKMRGSSWTQQTQTILFFFFFFSLVSQWSIDALHIEKKKKKGNNILKNTWILCATESSMGQNTWYQILSLKRWGHLFKIYLYGADAFVTWMSIYIYVSVVYIWEKLWVYIIVYIIV